MITSHTPHETPQPISRRTVGLASLIGAGTVCACWPLMLVWMFVGLIVGMPEDMGGMGASMPVATSVSSTAVALGAAGIVFVAMRLLRRAGAPRPLAVAVVGLLVAVCLFGVVIAGSTQLSTSSSPHATVLGLMLVPLAGAAGFALTTRIAQHRAATLTVALVSAAITATALWGW